MAITMIDHACMIISTISIVIISFTILTITITITRVIIISCTTKTYAGAYGTVYRAEDLKRNEIVAMKKVANDYIAVNIACILIFYCSLQNVFKKFSD